MAKDDRIVFSCEPGLDPRIILEELRQGGMAPDFSCPAEQEQWENIVRKHGLVVRILAGSYD